MKTWRPESWSMQAREMAENQIKQINDGSKSIAAALYFLNMSYRHSRIRIRAAKRLHRAIYHEHRVRETFMAFETWRHQEHNTNNYNPIKRYV